MRERSPLEPVEIVVGFVARGGRFLVRLRRGDLGLAGTWELPGGKVAPGEDHAAALTREVREETGLEVEVGERVCALCHTYADRRVALHAYLCAPFGAGAPTNASADPATPAYADGSLGRWVTPDEYLGLPIPAANAPLIDAFAWSETPGR
jgi:mutator protein MutT